MEVDLGAVEAGITGTAALHAPTSEGKASANVNLAPCRRQTTPEGTHRYVTTNAIGTIEREWARSIPLGD